MLYLDWSLQVSHSGFMHQAVWLHHWLTQCFICQGLWIYLWLVHMKALGNPWERAKPHHWQEEDCCESPPLQYERLYTQMTTLLLNVKTSALLQMWSWDVIGFELKVDLSWGEQPLRSCRLLSLLGCAVYEVTAINTVVVSKCQAHRSCRLQRLMCVQICLHAAWGLSHSAVFAVNTCTSACQCLWSQFDWMWGRSGGWAASCCVCLTSSVGALGTAGLLRRSFQRSFAGVRVISVHMGLLQAVEVRIWVYPVMVHGCSATTGHHHPFALGAVDKNCAIPPSHTHTAPSPPHSPKTRTAIWTTSFGGSKRSEKDPNVRQRRDRGSPLPAAASLTELNIKSNWMKRAHWTRRSSSTLFDCWRAKYQPRAFKWESLTTDLPLKH